MHNLRIDNRYFLQVLSSLACLILTVGLVARIVTASEANSTNLKKIDLTAACSLHLSNSVNAEELAKAAGVWMHEVGVAQGLNVDSQIDVTSDERLLRRRIDEGSLAIMSTTSVEYLNIDRMSLMPPVMTMSPSRHPKGKSQYLVLTDQSSPYSTVPALKGKSVLLYTRADPTLCRMWLEVLLQHDLHLSPAEQYFRSLGVALKPSTACLPVFFGKADACVIDDSSWALLRELNPQLGARLRVIAESPQVIETLVGLHVKQTEARDKILKGMLNLTQTPSGRQLLMFFKSQSAVSIGKEDLAETIQLRSTYLKLNGTQSARMP